MKKLLFVSIIFLFGSCSQNEGVPDVSSIAINLKIDRFEHDFFDIDTLNVDNSMQQLYQKYGNFTNIFVNNILGLSSSKDSIFTTENGIKLFIKTYKNVYDSVNNKYSKFEQEKTEIEKGFKFLKYYFPKYSLPNHIVTFVGPVDGIGIGLTEKTLAVGLQMYMGSDFVYYQNEYIRSIYPEYKSKRFEREYISVNVLTSLVEDMFPENIGGKALIDLMIDEGKKIYLLKKFMPYTKDFQIFGYSEGQLKGCYNSEASIWNFFITNDLLFQNEYQIIKDFINDGPKTQALGDASPGYIAKFVGLRIVEKWMESKKVTLEELMNTNNRAIYTEAKYKPRE